MTVWQTPEPLDRCVERRTELDWLRERWLGPGARVLRVGPRGQVPADQEGLRLERPARAFDPSVCWLLGARAGTTYFAVPAAALDGVSLRDAGPLLGDADYEIATTAVALANWHAREPFCPRCGSPTRVVSAGFARACDACGAEHFPRHDPAMIVAVLDPDNRLLLAHQHTWPAGRYSVLAGFCEAGESLEETVLREVYEEVGLRVTRPRYLASQPWPMPRSLMTAFVARAESTELSPDGVEITDARWFSPAEFDAARADGSLVSPASRSVAAWMIQQWRDGSLDEA